MRRISQPKSPIGSKVNHIDGKWVIVCRKSSHILDFPINPEKTRMQYWTSRQDVTGLVVNSKVNIRSEYRRTVRAMAQNLFMTGKFDFVQTTYDINGAKTKVKEEG